jgi:hypothetical protein
MELPGESGTALACAHQQRSRSSPDREHRVLMIAATADMPWLTAGLQNVSAKGLDGPVE